jgi:hypothetical protein
MSPCLSGSFPSGVVETIRTRFTPLTRQISDLPLETGSRRRTMIVDKNPMTKAGPGGGRTGGQVRASRTTRAAVGTFIGALLGVALVMDTTGRQKGGPSAWFIISSLVRVLICALVGYGIGRGSKATPPPLSPELEEAARAHFTPAIPPVDISRDKPEERIKQSASDDSPVSNHPDEE